LDRFEAPVSYRQYLKQLTPSVLTMVFLSFYTTIDGFFVSRYAGSDALAAINIVIPITCIIFGIAVMIASGAGAIIGERRGEQKDYEANQIFSTMCCVLAVFAILFTVFGLLFLRPFVTLLGSTERLMPHVLPYAAVTLCGTAAMTFKLFFEYMVRTDGNSRIGLVMSMTGLLLNLLLDYILVGVLSLGTLGAALGTVLSISVSALIGLVYFLRRSHLRFCRPHFRWSVLLRSCLNGIGDMLTEFSTGIITFLFNILALRYFGEDGVAAVTIIMYIYYFFIAFYMGITVGAAPVISYSLGADNSDKINETLRYSFITIAISSVLILAISLLGGPTMIGLFTGSETVAAITWEGLRLFSLLFLFIGTNVFLSGYFTALGNGLAAAVISTLRSLVLACAFLLILPHFLDVAGLWLAIPCSELVTLLISSALYYRHGRVACIRQRCLKHI